LFRVVRDRILLATLIPNQSEMLAPALALPALMSAAAGNLFR